MCPRHSQLRFEPRGLWQLAPLLLRFRPPPAVPRPHLSAPLFRARREECPLPPNTPRACAFGGRLPARAAGNGGVGVPVASQFPPRVLQNLPGLSFLALKSTPTHG